MTSMKKPIHNELVVTLHLYEEQKKVEVQNEVEVKEEDTCFSKIYLLPKTLQIWVSKHLIQDLVVFIYS